MRYATFSDTHSNWEALTRLIDSTQKMSIDRYCMLGDIVGYGADPQKVLDEVFRISQVIVRGNHDQAITDDDLLDWFNEEAKEAILWTREHLDLAAKEKLRELPYMRIEGNMTFVHASPFQPEKYDYLFEWKDARKSFRIFSTPLCFIGHTHLPTIFSEKLKAAAYLHEGTYQLDANDRYIISSGSVGQPRDRDKRLSFGIFDDSKYTFELVRLPYDKEEAARKIRAGGLPTPFADRLLAYGA